MPNSFQTRTSPPTLCPLSGTASMHAHSACHSHLLRFVSFYTYNRCWSIHTHKQSFARSLSTVNETHSKLMYFTLVRFGANICFLAGVRRTRGTLTGICIIHTIAGILPFGTRTHSERRRRRRWQRAVPRSSIR